jgi:nucleotide-binding universal stress UspA family protein
VTGQDTGWCALDQAIEIARREEGQIYGLHIVRSKARKVSDTINRIRAEFDQRCQSAGMQGRLVVEAGNLDRTICDRARWGDLVVSHLAHPQGFRPIVKLRSSFRTIIRRCPRPILAVPKTATPMAHLLLAYDGSPKALEALYVSAYLAARWNSSLVVASIQDDEAEFDAVSGMLTFARSYLTSRHITATFVQKSGVAGHMILAIAADHHCDLLLMGGYGYSPVVEAVIGSTLDHVLRHSQLPVLICR